MSWFDRFRKGKAANAVAPARPAAVPRGAQRSRAGEPLSGYGSNPYDTYTWELHTDPDGERELKRAHVIDRPKQQDGDTFNPYDTGKFSGGW
jgi:hypothetical protein